MNTHPQTAPKKAIATLRHFIFSNQHGQHLRIPSSMTIEDLLASGIESIGYRRQGQEVDLAMDVFSITTLRQSERTHCD